MRYGFMPLLVAIGSLVSLNGGRSSAADSTDAPRPLPATRPEMKALLEDLKARKPRIPLPELTDEQQKSQGGQAHDYEARLRSQYLPQSSGGRGGFSRGADTNMTLDYPFKTMMFWIVSRTNNCQYCLGHQEIKLSVAGLSEDRIAALDSNWDEFTPAERAAFAFARRLTYEPHLLSDDDIGALRQHYNDLQILEIVLSVAGNNSINRWKEGVGVPQSQSGRGFLRRGGPAPAVDRVMPIETFLTPTSERFQKSVSKVAPLYRNETSGELTAATMFRRPPLEPRDEVERRLAECRGRTPRLPLASDEAARAVDRQLPADEPAPNWVRLLAQFPREGGGRVRGLRAAEQSGDLSPALKAQVSWIVARQDRAWYATAEAKRRLEKLGISPDRIYALDGDWSDFSAADRALFTVARKLAASPIVLTDRDVDEAVKQSGPRATVQLIDYVTGRAFFNRVTEAARLPAE